MNELLIFELSQPGRRAPSHASGTADDVNLPAAALRDTPPLLPEASELQVVRHYTRLVAEKFFH